MSIGYTELDFINGTAPPLSAANLNHIDEGVKACADALDSPTALAALLPAATAAADGKATAAQITKLDGIEALADVTDKEGVAAAIESGTETAAPADTDKAVGVKSDHTLLWYTWANIWAWIIGKIEGGAATATPADADIIPSISAAHAAQKTTWAQIKAALTLDNITEGTTYKRVTAAEKTALTAGYTHLAKLAAAEAETALWDYDTAAKMPSALLREMVEAASGGAVTAKVDDLGYPSMMYILSGPKLNGYLHADYGSTTGIKTATLGAGGAGYTANDLLTVVKSGASGGIYRVLTVDGSGAVLTIRRAAQGTGYAVANGLATTGGTGTNATINVTAIGPVHPAFVVNGVEKNEILYSMYSATSYNSGAGARAVCWPGLFPTASLNFDASKALCVNKGAGWHLGSVWENNLITLLAVKGAMEPRGNTQYGQTHESGYQFNETAIRFDSLAPGLASGTAKHRNGSGPRFWSHNHDRWGIFDMVGDVWRWTDQLKLNNGEIFLTDDNYFELAEASWPTTGAFFDGNAKLWGSVHAGAYAASVVHTAQVMDASYDSLDLEVRRKLMLAGVTTRLTHASANPFTPKGNLSVSADTERLPICGGCWYAGADAGLAALGLYSPRSSVLDVVGFRPAFISS